MKKHLELTIYGKVQGVFFRAYTKKQADANNIFGWVKNNEDGSVSVVAEGEEINLKKFLNQCRQGSTASKVEAVEDIWNDNLNDFKSFDILLI